MSRCRLEFNGRSGLFSIYVDQGHAMSFPLNRSPGIFLIYPGRTEMEQRVRFLHRVEVWSMAPARGAMSGGISAKISRTPAIDHLYHTTFLDQHVLGVNSLDFLGQPLETRFDA